MRRPIEPLWWLLFAAGGTVAALVVPVLILLTGIAAPAGWAPQAFAHAHMRSLASHPLARIVLLFIISLPLFHWAHRFRYTLAEGLALKRAWVPVAVACYGAAVVGLIYTAAVVLRL